MSNCEEAFQLKRELKANHKLSVTPRGRLLGLGELVVAELGGVRDEFGQGTGAPTLNKGESGRLAALSHAASKQILWAHQRGLPQLSPRHSERKDTTLRSIRSPMALGGAGECCKPA